MWPTTMTVPCPLLESTLAWSLLILPYLSGNCFPSAIVPSILIQIFMREIVLFSGCLA